MNAITQLITQQATGPVVRAVAQRLGVSEGTAQMAVQVAVPLILSALARNAAQPENAQDLHRAVNEDHDGGILDNIMGYLGNPQAANGAGILGHVFGEQRGAVENNLAQATGLDQPAAGNLLEMVAPLVMGAVGRTQRQEGLDATGLAQFLDAQQQQTQESAPDMMRALSSMLDANRDGNVQDDVGRLLGNFFK